MRSKKEFVRALAEFLSGNAAEMSILLELKRPEGKRWAALRDATPLFGWPSVDETEKTLSEWLALKETLPRGKLKGGVLHCPHGHTGPFRYLEDVTEWRTVEGVEGDVLNIDCSTETYSESDDNPRLECRNDDGGHLCLAEFQTPDELEIDFV